MSNALLSTSSTCQAVISLSKPTQTRPLVCHPVVPAVPRVPAGGHTPHSQLLPLFTVQSTVPPHDRQEGVDPGVTAISEHLGQRQTYDHRSVGIHRVKL